MNAKDFFSKDVYEEIVNAYQNEQVISVVDTPFRKTIKTNGNVYSLAVSMSYYVPSVYNGAFHITLFYDFNHKEGYGSRSQYGGTKEPALSSYEAFCNSINEVLKRTPDFQEEEEQLCFF